jgi:hypothetical protein
MKKNPSILEGFFLLRNYQINCKILICNLLINKYL